jgi:hypothetical protein
MTTPMQIPYQPTNLVILNEPHSEPRKKPVILSEARSAQSKDTDEATPATSARPFLTRMPGLHALINPAITHTRGAR